MLVAGTAGIKTIHYCAELDIPHLERDLSIRASTKKIWRENAWLSGNFAYGMRAGRKGQPAGAAPWRVSCHGFAVDQDIEDQRDGVEDLQVQLRRAGFLQRPAHRSAIPGIGVAHPDGKIVIGSHHQFAITEIQSVDGNRSIGPRCNVEANLIAIE